MKHSGLGDQNSWKKCWSVREVWSPNLNMLAPMQPSWYCSTSCSYHHKILIAKVDLLVSMMPIKLQNGWFDCGLFNIAFGPSTISGLD